MEQDPAHLHALDDGKDLKGLDIQCPHVDHVITNGGKDTADKGKCLAARVTMAKRIAPFDKLHEHFRDDRYNAPSLPEPLLADQAEHSHDDKKNNPAFLEYLLTDNLISIEPQLPPAHSPMQDGIQVPHRGSSGGETSSSTLVKTPSAKSDPDTPLISPGKKKSKRGLLGSFGFSSRTSTDAAPSPGATNLGTLTENNEKIRRDPQNTGGDAKQSAQTYYGGMGVMGPPVVRRQRPSGLKPPKS